MVPGIQHGGHLEDNDETLVTEKNSTSDDIHPSDEGNNDSEIGMMKRIINSVYNLRDRAQLPHATDLDKALLLGL